MRISEAARDARKKVHLARLAAKANSSAEEYARMYANQPSEQRRAEQYNKERAAFRLAKHAAQDALIAEAGAGVAAFEGAGSGQMATVGAVAAEGGDE